MRTETLLGSELHLDALLAWRGGALEADGAGPPSPPPTDWHGPRSLPKAPTVRRDAVKAVEDRLRGEAAVLLARREATRDPFERGKIEQRLALLRAEMQALKTAATPQGKIGWYTERAEIAARDIEQGLADLNQEIERFALRVWLELRLHIASDASAYAEAAMALKAHGVAVTKVKCPPFDLSRGDFGLYDLLGKAFRAAHARAVEIEQTRGKPPCGATSSTSSPSSSRRPSGSTRTSKPSR